MRTKEALGAMAFGVRGEGRRLSVNRRSLKVPLQGVAIVVLSSALFLVWLGALVVLAKAVMG